MTIGLDIGSTTIKCVVIDEHNQIVYTTYERHYSQIAEKAAELLSFLQQDILGSSRASIMISGSAGMGLADRLSIPFIQEVYATRVATKTLVPDCDVVIELGGEDAKILFFNQGLEVRMNGSCAGGTGAFIDQMASLLNIPIEQFDALARQAQRTYTIASRCGVFAKSDIQPLLNQGAHKADIASSILQAVVNQTITGLAQGRPITGNAVYLGGPLTFMSSLRHHFDATLNLKGTCPQNSLLFVAMGAALCATGEMDLTTVVEGLRKEKVFDGVSYLDPLFRTQQEWDAFSARHAQNTVETVPYDPARPVSYLGIDAGSTTIKVVLLNDKKQIVFSHYTNNEGSPTQVILDTLKRVYEQFPGIEIQGSAVTGYGEHLIEHAFSVDYGIVETVAHLTAAQYFCPEVDFVIDIGGQDIKCFRIRNGSVDSIYLNEACSSGCGSFLQTFASSLSTDIEQFSKEGLFASYPVDLGSRCTVFMNSSVKQAQKEGIGRPDISAGLAISVVKNALYKVIRTTSTEALGRKIVVQGGTFHNDAVLRAFERELGREVIRPTISGLMGAYGAALYASHRHLESSTLLSYSELELFSHIVKHVTCNLCTNACRLTVNTFASGEKYISGNRCSRPLKGIQGKKEMNLVAWKLDQLRKLDLFDTSKVDRHTIGIPLGLNNYELIYFWKPFFETFGLQILLSPLSTRRLYLSGQASVTSDTLCFPAKLMHGHIQSLLDAGVSRIFYPVMSYNIDDHQSDNRFNCPVVAYYPETLNASMDELKEIDFIRPPIDLERIGKYPKKMLRELKKYFPDMTLPLFREAVQAGWRGYSEYRESLIDAGRNIIREAQEDAKQLIILAGRPYHIDPEVLHGIDTLLTGLGCAVITEDALPVSSERIDTKVLNQWTYHARLYNAAKIAGESDSMALVQLVSFGCGVDAITTDEIRQMLESKGKMYTQLKIDEITNLGAVTIRIRSLLSALKEERTHHGT